MDNSGFDLRTRESHDAYAKRVMCSAFGPRFHDMFTTEIDYGAGRPARIDGTLDRIVAIEIESRVSKQVRGALLDLICHRYPKKLLILLPAAGHMTDGIITAKQCEFILAKFLPGEDYRVVIFSGCGLVPCLESDIALVRGAVEKWLSLHEP